MATRVGGAGGYLHYLKHQKRGDKTMPCAIVLGCPPYVAFMGPQKLPIGVDEFDVAGGLAGAPINVVKAKTVDLLVPAEAEIVIEGLIDTEYCRARGAVRRIARPRRARGIQHADARHRDHASQESGHPVLHQPGRALRIERHQARRLRAAVPRAPARRARHPRRQARVAARAADRAAARHRDHASRKACRAPRSGARSTARPSSRATCGKICIAVNEDIDPDNADALLWAMAYRMNPVEDVQTLAAPRPGPRPEARARRRGGFDAADRRDHEGRHAAARAAEEGIHGARAGRSGRNSACRSCARSRRGSAIRSATGCRSGTRRRSARSRAATSKTAASARSRSARASSPRPSSGRGSSKRSQNTPSPRVSGESEARGRAGVRGL